LQWPDIDFEANVIRVRQALYWNFGKEQKRNAQGLKYLLISPKRLLLPLPGSFL